MREEIVELQCTRRTISPPKRIFSFIFSFFNLNQSTQKKLTEFDKKLKEHQDQLLLVYIQEFKEFGPEQVWKKGVEKAKVSIKTLVLAHVEFIANWIPRPISAPELCGMIIATAASETFKGLATGQQLIAHLDNLFSLKTLFHAIETIFTKGQSFGVH